MASKTVATTALLLTFNLLFFTLVSSTVPCPPPTPPKTPECNSCTPKNPTAPANTPPKSPPPSSTCPIDTLKLNVCAGLLDDLLHLIVGSPSKTPCCSLLGGLADLDASVCLCTAIKANILGINLDVPISLSLLSIACGKNEPEGFHCA